MPAKGAPAAVAPTKRAGEKLAGEPGEAKHEKGAAHGAALAAQAAAAAGKHAAASPDTDPAFQAVVHHAKAVAKHQATHAPASAKAAEAHAAAVSPPNEVSSRAAAKQTDVMDQQQPKPFNRAAFKETLLRKIKETAPKTLGEADEFKKSGKLDGVKSDLTSQVSQEKKESQGAIAEKTAEAPDRSGIEPKPTTPLPPPAAGPAPEVAAVGAAPKPASDAAVSLQAGPQELNQQMADAGVTEEQLQHSNEPAFQSALAQKKTAEKESEQAPQEYRAKEAGMLSAAQADAQTVATKHLTEMHGARKSILTGVAGHQTDSKAEEEKQRAEVSAHIEQIYDQTKKAVEDRLKKLDDDVNKAFDDGATAAQKAFEDYVDQRMWDYKVDRYFGPAGPLLWAKDKLLGMPDEVNAFYQEGHDRYVAQMDGVIDHVAELVETGLNEAKGAIAAGKAEIQTYIHGLPAALQETGRKAAVSIQGEFDALEQSVTAKQDQLVDGLAKKYNDNVAKLNARIDEMKAANRGLVDAARDALKGVLQTIIDLKNMLLNVLSRAAGAIGMIIAHPIDFLGHLVDAGKRGFMNFVDHIGEHLKKGFMEWLFGAVAETGIQLPEHFDLHGIFSLVMQILGLTYANIRSRAVKILGEKVVSALEKAAEIFKILITKGPSGLWEYIKEKIGDLKAMVIDKIRTFVMEKIIVAGITWLIGLLNPASAFVKACKAIYDIVMFFVERGKQILDLVNAIINSITAIAKGAIAAAANFVESSLARTIPVVIGFLASLLGVGGITEKIKEIIEAIRKPINDAIDWVINKAVDIVKAVGGFLGLGKDEKKKEDKTGFDGQVGRKVAWSVKGQQHELWIVTNGTETVVMVASETKTVAAQLAEYESQAQRLKDDQKKVVLAKVASARAELAKLDAKSHELAIETKKPQPDPATENAEEKQVESDENSLVAFLQEIQDEIGLTGDFGTERNPIPLDWPKRRLAQYPVIYLGPEPGSDGKRIEQDWLRDGDKRKIKENLDAEALRRWEELGEKITAYRPGEETSLPNGKEVGVAPKWRVDAGLKIAMTKSEGTGGGGKINQRFAPYGFRAGKEGLDGDHVVERQLGGEDEIANLWPLDSSENRGAGSALKGKTFKAPDGSEVTLSDLKKKASPSNPVWFQIVSTR